LSVEIAVCAGSRKPKATKHRSRFVFTPQNLALKTTQMASPFALSGIFAPTQLLGSPSGSPSVFSYFFD
jgi:hypothetical protein